jgi:hypothetical protein
LQGRTRLVGVVLANLVALDAVLATWGFCFPTVWFRFFHDAPYVDPQGLLRRCAANWLAFAIVQAIALVRWQRDPRWLAAVAGMRLGDALTDVTCLTFASSTTAAAWVLFPIAGLGNLVIGWWLLWRAPR